MFRLEFLLPDVQTFYRVEGDKESYIASWNHNIIPEILLRNASGDRLQVDISLSGTVISSGELAQGDSITLQLDRSDNTSPENKAELLSVVYWVVNEPSVKKEFEILVKEEPYTELKVQVQKKAVCRIAPEDLFRLQLEQLNYVSLTEEDENYLQRSLRKNETLGNSVEKLIGKNYSTKQKELLRSVLPNLLPEDVFVVMSYYSYETFLSQMSTINRKRLRSIMFLEDGIVPTYHMLDYLCVYGTVEEIIITETTHDIRTLPYSNLQNLRHLYIANDTNFCLSGVELKMLPNLEILDLPSNTSIQI